MFDAIMNYQFMQHALIACVLASVVCGIMGVIITQKKLIMMSSGIAHTAYGGVGLGYLFGFEPMIGAVLFSVLAALGIGFTKRRGNISDVTVAMFWSLGMALGIAFIGLMPGYPPSLDSYLFGSILAVTRSDLQMMAGMVLVVCVLFVVFYYNWKSYLFDDQFAMLRGNKTAFLEYLLLILVALTVVTLIRVAGIILVLALLTTPSATASLLSQKFRTRIILSILFGMLYCFGGIWLSYTYNIASGATIIIFAISTYVLLYAVSLIGKKHKASRSDIKK